MNCVPARRAGLAIPTVDIQKMRCRTAAHRPDAPIIGTAGGASGCIRSDAEAWARRIAMMLEEAGDGVLEYINQAGAGSQILALLTMQSWQVRGMLKALDDDCAPQR
jgi:hypothetical protein